MKQYLESISYNTLLVDDEPNSIENISILLQEYCPSLNIVGIACSLKEAKKQITVLQPDIVFLDIHLGNKTIFELLESLHTIPFEIIFLTADDSFALKAFNYNAVDYLLKPVDIKKLKEAVSKTLIKLRGLIMKPISANQKVIFPLLNGYRLEYISNILYLLADGSYTNVMFNEGSKLVVSKNIKHYELRLGQYGFIRIHPSVLINYEKVKEISRSDGGYVTMENGKTLPISKSKRKDFEEFIKQYNL